MDFEQLQAQCMNCTRCGLHEGRTNVVFGMGNPGAPVMFVGEGPGQHEDEQGLPFVGRSGKLLDLYLDVVDLDREKVYIANIVKCRPPENRDPLPEESDTCLYWLRQQYKLIQPKILVCLGRVAAQRLIDPKFSVTRQHGEFILKGGTWFMGTFHPAALLRNGGQKPTALADFLALRTKIEEVCPELYRGR
ncbi:MAG: uracil-DNA glycosylase [Oscillospiraceae bacterium]|nr:uracil-DNA glycosylase [Oscillospiraceae bacterium]